MQIRFRAVKVFTTIAASIYLSACTDHHVVPTEIAVSVSNSATSNVQGANLRLVTRVLAQAFRDPKLLRYVGRAMRDSRHKEHKLRFTELLLRPQSTKLLSELAQLSGKRPAEFSAILATLPDLQFFVPVARHRRRWNGERNVYVASVADSGRILAYDTSGAQQVLAENVEPSNATFVLLPSEQTNWVSSESLALTDSLPSHVSLLVGDGCSEYAIIECDGGSGSGGGGGPPPPGPVVSAAKPSGTYIVYARIFDDGESWIRGQPEIEIHFVGPNPYAVNSVDVRSRVCYYHNPSNGGPDSGDLDINGDYWSGAVKLFEPVVTNLPYYYDPTVRPYQVQFWEDDHIQCSIEVTLPVWKKFFQNTGLVAATFILYHSGNSGYSCGTECKVFNALGILAQVIFFADAVTTSKDDPVGVLMPNDTAVSNGLQVEPGTTHTLVLPKDNGSYFSNGGVRLVQHVTGVATY
jgi:hypothetical protein